MAGDRTTYRNIYPGILRLSEEDVWHLIGDEPHPEEFTRYISELYEDVERIRGGVTMLTWPVEDLLDFVLAHTAVICATLFAQIGKLPRRGARATAVLSAARGRAGR